MINRPVIKNIVWDVDGVLANLNFAYFNFLKNHPAYTPLYGNITWNQLPQILPIVPKYGSLELKTHPKYGVQMDKDFCASWKFYSNRPLYDGALETLKYFHKLGYNQMTASACFNVETKKKLLHQLLPNVDFLHIECVQHGQFMHDSAKEDLLKHCFAKYDWKAEETVLIDDRIYNQKSIINIGGYPIRFRCEFTSDLPKELSFIPEAKSYDDIKTLLADTTKLRNKP